MTGHVGSAISKSGMVENVGVAIGIASPSVSIQTFFHFRFPLPVSWPTFELPMLGRVGSAISKSGMVENMGAAVEISFIVVIHAQESCICADFKAFPVFRAPYWISGMCQIWFEGAIL